MGIIDTEDWEVPYREPSWLTEQNTYNKAIIDACGSRIEIAPGEIIEIAQDAIMTNSVFVGKPVTGWVKMNGGRSWFPLIAVSGDTAWKLDGSRQMATF